MQYIIFNCDHHEVLNVLGYFQIISESDIKPAILSDWIFCSMSVDFFILL